VSGQIGEVEETIPQSGVVQQVIIPRSVSQSKKMVAIFLAAILAPAVFFALRTGKHKGRSPTTGEGKSSVIVHTGAAYQGDMGVYIDALGTVTPITTVNIYSQASGQVLAVHYREGQIVHKGDPLLDIDSRPYQAQLQQAEGLLDHDRGVLKQAEIDLARYREAFASHAVAKQVLDDQEQAVIQDQGAVKYDLEQVQYAEVELSLLPHHSSHLRQGWAAAYRFREYYFCRQLEHARSDHRTPADHGCV
jgi:multidrug efflux system membrane fusion protein